MKQMDDIALQLRVHLRDRSSGSAIGDFTESEWLSSFHHRIGEVIGSWARTFGGTMVLGGAIEQGRLTVYETPAAATPLVDLDWFTWAVQPPGLMPEK